MARQQLVCHMVAVFVTSCLCGVVWRTPTSHLCCEEFHSEARVDNGMARYLGTKLPYQFHTVISNESSIHGCLADKVFAVIRHGTRYPTHKHITSWDKFFKERIPKQPLEFHNSLLQTLISWTNPFSHLLATDGAAQLNDHGVKEQFCLAKRLRARLPTLFGQRYSHSLYSIQSTSLPRTIMSAQAFTAGLFDGHGPLNGYQPVHIESIEEDGDVHLRYDEQPCPLYDSHVTLNQSLHATLRRFTSGQEIQTSLHQVQQRLDPERIYWNVTLKDMLTMYKLCVHELGLLGNSQWCEPFSKESLESLFYLSDMKTYWKKGGGFPITWKRSVHLVQSILDFLTDSSTYSIALRFGHSETLLPLLAFFSVYKDEQHLLPEAYQELHLSRQFVTSNLSPFSSNALFIRYTCSGAAGGGESHYVRLLVNEVEVPLCKAQTLCALEELTEFSKNRSDNWKTLTQLCSSL